jgi:RNA polymerase sigma-70 factor, ECF subfamily
MWSMRAGRVEPRIRAQYTIVSVPPRKAQLRQQAPLQMRGLVPFPIPEGDAALVAALRSGRVGAAAALFERHGRLVQRVLARVLGPDPDLGDLLHDVFVQALESLDRLDEPKQLRIWLTSIAVFTARGHIRRRRRWRIVQYLPLGQLPEPGVSSRVEEWSEPLRATYRVFDQLGDDDRILIALRYIDGLELTEVAAAVGISLATVKRRLQRAQARFSAFAREEPALVDWIKEDLR